jgi:type I restriction enzyme R subunit
MDMPDFQRDEYGEIDTEELVNYLIESRKMLNNASYFAFTATPKNKTLETFGIRQSDGSFKAFHTYSMKQAIEEEYILDVLQNYTTYRSYYKIKSESSDFAEKEFETKEANKRLKSFVEGNELAIYEKAKIMIDHFNVNVRHLINSKAKAMVVTKSIESAMKYKDAFDRYLSESNLPYKAIVAFSGRKRHYKSGIEMTEVSMNAFPDNENNIPKQFVKDEYKFLIVANKYQTGFDQPLLHTMYVDKQLSDVQAVQTLSRLNRAYKPWKKDTMVLDFYNEVEDIKMAFEPYYTTTVLSEETDVNKLNDLQDALDEVQVYSPEDVEGFFKVYHRSNRNMLEVMINNCVVVFERDLEKDIQVLFKSNAKNFMRTYAYLSKIIDYSVGYWEKLWLFLKHLIPKLKIRDEAIDENILEDIDMDSYRINRIGTTKVSLEVNEGIIDPIPVSSTGMFTEKHYDTLEHIISEFNQRFGNINWGSDVDKAEVEKILVDKIPTELKRNLDLLKSIRNSDKENAKITSDEKVMALMQSLVFTNAGLYKKFCSDDDFKKRYQEFVFDILFDVIRQDRYTSEKGFQKLMRKK